MTDLTPEAPRTDEEAAHPSPPDAITSEELDDVRAEEVPDEEDAYQLRSGIPDAPNDADPGSMLNR